MPKKKKAKQIAGRSSLSTGGRAIANNKQKKTAIQKVTWPINYLKLAKIDSWPFYTAPTKNNPRPDAYIFKLLCEEDFLYDDTTPIFFSSHYGFRLNNARTLQLHGKAGEQQYYSISTELLVFFDLIELGIQSGGLEAFTLTKPSKPLPNRGDEQIIPDFRDEQIPTNDTAEQYMPIPERYEDLYVKPVHFLEWFEQRGYFVPGGLINSMRSGDVKKSADLLKDLREKFLEHCIDPSGGAVSPEEKTVDKLERIFLKDTSVTSTEFLELPEVKELSTGLSTDYIGRNLLCKFRKKHGVQQKSGRPKKNKYHFLKKQK